MLRGLMSWVALGMGATALADEFDVCDAALQKGWRGGAGDRIYYFSDFRFNPVPASVFADVDVVLQTLKARGIEVIVVPLPSPALVTAKHVELQPGDAWTAQGSEEIYNAIRDRLSRHATVVDVLKIARQSPEDFYLHRDYHWTVDGSRRTAEAVAAVIRSSPSYAALPKSKFESYELERPPYKVSGYNKLVGDLCGREIPMELAPTLAVRRSGSTTSTAIIEETTTASVAVVGSSFMDPIRGFPGFLSQGTDAEVLTVFLNAGEALGALLQYTRSDEFQKSPPKYLIWEVSQNSLGFLPRPTKGSTSFQDPLIYRQIQGAVNGDCAPAAAALSGKAELTAPGTFSVITNPESVPVTPQTHFLSIRMRNPAVDTFQVLTEFADGTSESYPFIHQDRVPPNGRFFLSFPPNTEEVLTNVSVVAPAGTDGGVTMRVCPRAGVK